MRIQGRFNGPVGSGNGGITCGRLAAYVGAPAVEVTLRRPPPLDTDLRVDASGGTARLYDGDLLVAEAAPTEVDVEPGPPVSLDAAAATAPHYAGLVNHPFPTCFSCGTDRTDGLGLRPGPLGDGRVACVWTPNADDRDLLWAALDCPGGWSSDIVGRPMVLGRMALQSHTPVTVGAPHVVVGWTVATEGRKTQTATALYDATGAVLALARATWIALPTA